MNVAVVKYNAGNIYSVIHALQRMGVKPVLTDDPEDLQKADKVLFPGQGEASHAMRYLREHRLDEVICNLKQPILGICIGQQLMCRHSEEGDVDCLGIFETDVLRFQPLDFLLRRKVAWNCCRIRCMKQAFHGMTRTFRFHGGILPNPSLRHNYEISFHPCEPTIRLQS